MPCDELPDNLNSLWSALGADRAGFSPDQMRREILRVQAKRRRGQTVLVCAMLLVATGYALSLFVFPNILARIGATLSVVVCGYWLVHVMGQRSRHPLNPGETDGRRFYKTELENARDDLRWMSWRWLLIPGPFILFDVGCAQMYAKVAPFLIWFVCFDSALLIAALAIWAPMKNLARARKYQACIDAINGSAR